jgi:hypothetical protein
MSQITYAELVAKLQAWMEDDDAEFVGSIDDIINLGEMRLWKDLDLSIFTSEDTVATVGSQATVTKPTSDPQLVSWQSIYYDNGSVRTFLELRSTDFVRDHQTIGATSAPKYYAETNETDWLLSPIPDAIYTLNARGVTRPTRLSGSQTTTWLSTHQDDLLFKACLAEAEGFLKSDDRVPMWVQQYVDALPLAKRETYELLNQRYNLTPLEVPAVPTTQR